MKIELPKTITSSQVTKALDALGISHYEAIRSVHISVTEVTVVHGQKAEVSVAEIPVIS